ncbi:MAG: AgmX/PglI C-terminal domain-containing protein [Deltaproteobacteria bacterium]|nr:AgmX/PglI C-terminal domain-containing protein [Deltaproteobacteria bacterium]
MSIQFPVPLPFPVGFGQDATPALQACPRPPRPRLVADLSKVEDPSRQIGEFVAVWNGAVLGVKHFTRKSDNRSFRVGENPACDVWLPLEQLGGHDDVRLVRVNGDRITVTVLPDATAEVHRADGSSAPLADLIRDGRTTPSTQLEGAHEVTLEPGDRMHQDFGQFSFLASMVARPKLVLPRRHEFKTAGFVAASLAIHVVFLAVAWRSQADHDGIAIDVASQDQAYAQLMTMAPPLALDVDEIQLEEENEDQALEEEIAADDPSSDDADDREEGGSGARAAGDEGLAGDRNAPDADRMMAVKGPRDNPNPQMAKTKLAEAALASGVMRALTAIQDGAPTSMFSPYTTALGNDPISTRGHLMGSDYGPAYGVGGLGMFGTGAGGNGSNIYGFGLGEVGLMGPGYGTGDGVGIGRGHDDLGRHPDRRPSDTTPTLRAHTESDPDMRIVDVFVGGGLSKEVIQRVMRLQHNRIKHCYESALHSSPDLSGRVTVNFTVAPEGYVRGVRTVSNSLDDGSVAQCIEGIIGRLNFPAVDGITTATYPFLFQTAGAD